MPTNDELRLITRVTKMYYELGNSQAEIAARLSLSQSTVSRLIHRAREEGIIRFNIHIPAGVNVDLEEKLVARYGLKDAVVVDSIAQDEAQLMHDLGSAAAFYIDATLRDNEVVGISSWSSSLLALVDAMRPLSGKKCAQVVQILGGVGNPAAEVHATRLTGRFAALVNATPFYLPAPGIVGSEGALRVLLEDPYVKEAVDLFELVTLALVGIGTVEPSKLLNLSGNVFSQVEQDALRRSGAVGDILMRFFDHRGRPVDTPFNQRVISMSLEQLRRVERSVAVAGGERKFEAIHAALLGGWINILITDHLSAEKLAAT